ncbi:unnamed protein product [Rotaria magnacalcarata]|uniref:Transmembrane protein 222 n=1 Tax=Rotaria magnacalcarata TaxID=392030 RepID=A0A816DMM2_9BILA|nr:unnamed protein product [Rotaria magnacalcarata]CAF1640676.1 unnamed protein product [Rotaria magnacalcarata]CAF1907384.1 unnamed protein product [Rotaria magnacalcarata]CAF2092006.1 unnamed protein product [Rotaria magnacalcarata]CAF2154308.1 unnamed protein product [Rotaria magnacalcarata]
MSIITGEKILTTTNIPIEDSPKQKQTQMIDHSFLPDNSNDRIDSVRVRYPHCIVWTPIPVLTWLFPFVGHMGIARTDGVIRDFAGPYYVSEDNMAFGLPTRYIQLDLNRVSKTENSSNIRTLWDKGVEQASDEYKNRMHNLCCDNCHSHVAMALNTMGYDRKYTYNMVSLAIWMFFCGKFVSVLDFLRSLMPFLIIACIIITIIVVVKFHT